MRALAATAASQYHDLVGPADLRETMGDEDGGAAHGGGLDRLLDLVLGGAVDGAGRVVQDEDGGIGEEGAGQGQPLALPAREHYAAFADHGVVLLRESHDEVVGLSRPRRRLDLALVASGLPKRMLSAMERLKRKTSCSMIEICRRSEARFQSRTSMPSTVTLPWFTS